MDTALHEKNQSSEKDFSYRRNDKNENSREEEEDEEEEEVLQDAYSSNTAPLFAWH